jgi:hypothetical protein
MRIFECPILRRSRTLHRSFGQRGALLAQKRVRGAVEEADDNVSPGPRSVRSQPVW